MSYISIEELSKYSAVHTDNIELQQKYIDSAEEIIESYLGYNPASIILQPYIYEFMPSMEVPELIKMTALRIATLLQTESDNNIGVTSKSFGDSGNRTFINTVNFDKYLIQISQYRKIRI